MAELNTRTGPADRKRALGVPWPGNAIRVRLTDIAGTCKRWPHRAQGTICSTALSATRWRVPHCGQENSNMSVPL